MHGRFLDPDTPRNDIHPNAPRWPESITWPRGWFLYHFSIGDLAHWQHYKRDQYGSVWSEDCTIMVCTGRIAGDTLQFTDFEGNTHLVSRFHSARPPLVPEHCQAGCANHRNGMPLRNLARVCGYCLSAPEAQALRLLTLPDAGWDQTTQRIRECRKQWLHPAEHGLAIECVAMLRSGLLGDLWQPGLEEAWRLRQERRLPRRSL